MRKGQVSTTAQRVAAQRLAFTRVEADHGRPQDDDALQADVAAGTSASTSTMTAYLQGRTTFFDQVVVQAIKRGVTQIAIVGAGYDGRALRYAKPGISWFELDHPDTQADKRERLERLGIDTTGIAFASADFATDDVADALAQAGQDASRATLFICEGVAGYLTRAVFERLLVALAARAKSGSQLAITIPLDAESTGQQLRRLALGKAVAKMGEPLQLSISRPELAIVLVETGWDLGKVTRVGIMAKRKQD
jgi:methyltransferase (TIGR00027 family)